mgnify:FL=1
MNKTFLFYWFTALFLSSCSVYNSNKLLSDSKDPSYTIERVHPKNQEETIQSGDELSIKIYPNDGENALMSIASINAEQATAKMEDGFTVSSTGEIRIPLVGVVMAKGLTTSQLTEALTLKLTMTIQSPYVEVSITNQRLMLFNGKGAGQVIPLANEAMTLMEVIALGGGIKEHGKSNQIRLFRMENGVRKIYEFDLSEINNLKNADVTVQNRDILVIDHHPRNAQNTLRDAGPWISILTSGLVVFSIFSKL